MTRTVHHSVTMQADPDTAWSVLIDFQRRREWDPYYRDVVGKAEVGARLTVRASLADDARLITTHPVVVDVEPGRRLVWTNRFVLPGVLDSRQEFQLTSAHAGLTVLRQTEHFSGLMTRLSGRTLDRVEARLHQWVVAYQDRVESQVCDNPG